MESSIEQLNEYIHKTTPIINIEQGKASIEDLDESQNDADEIIE